jgi:hypothetical protein
MSGGDTGVVLIEALGRHLFKANSGGRSSLTPYSYIRGSVTPLRRSAMQGSGKDHPGTAATRLRGYHSPPGSSLTQLGKWVNLISRECL